MPLKQIRNQHKQTPKKSSHVHDRGHEIRLMDLLSGWRDRLEERRKQWRLHRKLMAKSTPLEFCLRPHLALLLYCLALSLLGRGLSHLQGETPYWSVWWNESLASPLAWLWSGSWFTYSTSSSVEASLNLFERVLMWSFLICGLICLYAPYRLSQSLRTHGQASSLNLKGAQLTRQKKQVSTKKDESQRLAEPPKSAKSFARIFIFALILQSLYIFSLWVSHEYRLASFIEHLLQISLPLTCWIMLPYRPQSWEAPAQFLIQVTLALCFVGHGIYALNLSPLPADFLIMTMNLTHLSEEGALSFLSLMGTLDLMAAIGLFLPIHEIRRSALIYMMIWGLLTALARPLGQPMVSLLSHLVQWGPECIWRLTHALIPLWLWRRFYAF